MHLKLFLYLVTSSWGFGFSVGHLTFCTFSDYCSGSPVWLLYHCVLITKYCARTVIILHSILAASASLPFPYPSSLYLPYPDWLPFLSHCSGMCPAHCIARNSVFVCISAFGFGVTVHSMPVFVHGVVLILYCFCLLSLYVMWFGCLLYENGAVIAGICVLRD